jgi:hypothetical protein
VQKLERFVGSLARCTSGGILLAALLVFSALCGTGASLEYALDVTVDCDAGRYAGEESVVYTNPTEEPLDEIFFRLYANGGAMYGGARVKVTGAWFGASPVSTELFNEDTILMLPLDVPLMPNQTASIRLVFEGEAAPGLGPTATAYGILTKTEDALTMTAFYPIVAPLIDEGWSLDPVFGIGDALFAESASYDVTLHGAPDWLPVAPGRLEAHDVDPADTARFHIEGARDFSIAWVPASTPVTALQTNGITLRAYFAAEHQAAATIALEDAMRSVAVYSERIGRLPYSEINLVEVPLQAAAGVEFTGLILIDRGYSALPDDPFFHVIVTHELAHQWFYATVGSDPVEAPWLDEGLATYLSNVALEAGISPGTAESERAAWQRTTDWAQRAYPDLSATSPVYLFPDNASYSAYAYSAAALEFWRLNQQLGETTFDKALSVYYTSHRFGIASPQELFDAFTEACGCPARSPLFAGETADRSLGD